MLAPKPGERLIDIGSGLGGPARYLAKVCGCKVTGIDLTAEFVATATDLARRAGLAAQVDFQQASATDLPFSDGSFDLAWSQNVAMNIADRPRYYAEMRRVLKPGGRLAISDVVNTAALSPELQADPALLCGCIAGAAPVERIETWLAQAGFTDVRVTPKPESRELVASWAPGRGIENFVASATIEARKPARDGASRG